MTTSGCWFFIAVASNVILVVRQVVSGFRIPASSLFIQKFKTWTIWRCWRNRKVFAYYSISSLAVLKKKDITYYIWDLFVNMFLMNWNKIQYPNMESLFSTPCQTNIFHSSILFLGMSDRPEYFKGWQSEYQVSNYHRIIRAKKENGLNGFRFKWSMFKSISSVYIKWWQNLLFLDLFSQLKTFWIQKQFSGMKWSGDGSSQYPHHHNP